MKSSCDAVKALLVTGASGFIGRHLCRALREQFPTAVIVALHRPGSPPVADDRTVAVAADLVAGLECLPDAPSEFDGVFHLAAHTPKAGGRENHDAIVASNVLGLHHVLGAVEGRTKRFVFASAIDVYGMPRDGEIVTEESPLRPATVYAASKLLGEVLVRSWGRMAGVKTAIVRVGHTYGPGEGAYQKVIPATIRRVLDGKPAAVYGTGQELRDFLYVQDAAAGLVAAWVALERGDVGPVNLVTGRSVSVAEVIAVICEESGFDQPPEWREASLPLRSLRFDATKLAYEVMFSAATSLRDGIRAEIRWFRESTTRHG